jgi:hypothetical protein
MTVSSRENFVEPAVLEAPIDLVHDKSGIASLKSVRSRQHVGRAQKIVRLC